MSEVGDSTCWLHLQPQYRVSRHSGGCGRKRYENRLCRNARPGCIPEGGLNGVAGGQHGRLDRHVVDHLANPSQSISESTLKLLKHDFTSAPVQNSRKSLIKNSLKPEP